MPYMPPHAKASRAPKQIGDFGEGLVTYLLVRRGYWVANVDNIGADLIAERKGKRLAISVKTRLFRPKSKEYRAVSIAREHLSKLRDFARRFDMQPMFAQVVSIADEKTIHLFLLSADDIPWLLGRPTSTGYRLRFARKHLSELIAHPQVHHSEWGEKLGDHPIRNANA